MDQEGRANIAEDMLVRLTKTTTAQVSTSADGSLIRRALFLHNTKRATSDKLKQA